MMGTAGASPGRRSVLPVTVLDRERVLVLGRRERLTPLARLELLATERMEPGLWAGKASIAEHGSVEKKKQATGNCLQKTHFQGPSVPVRKKRPLVVKPLCKPVSSPMRRDRINCCDSALSFRSHVLPCVL